MEVPAGTMMALLLAVIFIGLALVVAAGLAGKFPGLSEWWDKLLGKFDKLDNEKIALSSTKPLVCTINSVLLGSEWSGDESISCNEFRSSTPATKSTSSFITLGEKGETTFYCSGLGEDVKCDVTNFRLPDHFGGHSGVIKGVKDEIIETFGHPNFLVYFQRFPEDETAGWTSKAAWFDRLTKITFWTACVASVLRPLLIVTKYVVTAPMKITKIPGELGKKALGRVETIRNFFGRTSKGKFEWKPIEDASTFIIDIGRDGGSRASRIVNILSHDHSKKISIETILKNMGYAAEDIPKAATAAKNSFSRLESFLVKYGISVTAVIGAEYVGAYAITLLVSVTSLTMNNYPSQLLLKPSLKDADDAHKFRIYDNPGAGTYRDMGDDPMVSPIVPKMPIIVNKGKSLGIWQRLSPFNLISPCRADLKVYGGYVKCGTYFYNIEEGDVSCEDISAIDAKDLDRYPECGSLLSMPEYEGFKKELGFDPKMESATKLYNELKVIENMNSYIISPGSKKIKTRDAWTYEEEEIDAFSFYDPIDDINIYFAKSEVGGQENMIKGRLQEQYQDKEYYEIYVEGSEKRIRLPVRFYDGTRRPGDEYSNGEFKHMPSGQIEPIEMKSVKRKQKVKINIDTETPDLHPDRADNLEGIPWMYECRMTAPSKTGGFKDTFPERFRPMLSIEDENEELFSYYCILRDIILDVGMDGKEYYTTIRFFWPHQHLDSADLNKLFVMMIERSEVKYYEKDADSSQPHSYIILTDVDIDGKLDLLGHYRWAGADNPMPVLYSNIEEKLKDYAIYQSSQETAPSVGETKNVNAFMTTNCRVDAVIVEPDREPYKGKEDYNYCYHIKEETIAQYMVTGIYTCAWVGTKFLRLTGFTGLMISAGIDCIAAGMYTKYGQRMWPGEKF